MAPSSSKFHGWPPVLCFALALLLGASLSPTSAGFHPKRYNHLKSEYGLFQDHRNHLLSFLKVIRAINYDVDANTRACSLYKHCKPGENGEMIPLNPKNDTYLKSVIDYVNSDETCKKRIENMNLNKTEDASKMAAFLYSLNYPTEVKFYTRFNNITRNFLNGHYYPYCHFYTALFNLKITPQLDSFQFVCVKNIGGTNPPKILDKIVLYRGSTKDYFNKNENATFQFEQYTSFSRKLKTAIDFAERGDHNSFPTIFMIQENNVPARSIQEYSMYPDESEYLIDPISKFKIVRVFKNVHLENFETNLATVYVIKYVGNPCD